MASTANTLVPSDPVAVRLTYSPRPRRPLTAVRRDVGALTSLLRLYAAGLVRVLARPQTASPSMLASQTPEQVCHKDPKIRRKLGGPPFSP